MNLSHQPQDSQLAYQFINQNHQQQQSIRPQFAKVQQRQSAFNTIYRSDNTQKVPVQNTEYYGTLSSFGPKQKTIASSSGKVTPSHIQGENRT